MPKTSDLSGISDCDLFSELLERQQLQAAFAMFARLADRMSSAMDRPQRDSSMVRELEDRQRQLAEMWRVGRVPPVKDLARAVETQLFRNLMESHVVEQAGRSDRHRKFLSSIVGADQLESLPYVRSESAARWMVGQMWQVEGE